MNRLNECEIVTPTKKKVGVELLYNSSHRKFNQLGDQTNWRQNAVEKTSIQQREPSGPRLISWVSDEVEIRCSRENQHPERLGPRLSSPGERERNAVMTNRVGVNMLQFCSVSNSLSHTTYNIKWEVYFSKNCVARLYCVEYATHIYGTICVHLYFWVFLLLILLVSILCI